MALHKCVQRNLPVTVVGGGLPQIAELAGEAKSYSERLFTFPVIGGLDEADAASALTSPATNAGVTFEPEAVALAQELTSGYPFFIQELGYAAWPSGPTRSTLVEKGPLYTPSHGYAAFTVPHFDRYMLRAVPDLVVPPLRPRRLKKS